MRGRKRRDVAGGAGGIALALLGISLLGAAGLAGCRPGAPAGESPPPAGSPGEMCVEHGVAEARCPFCNASLIEEMGMCVEHGVPEALCTRCSPSLVSAFRAEGDWCEGHGLPESQCTACNPELLEGEPAGEPIPPDGARMARVEPRPDDEQPRSQRPPSVRCDTERVRIRLESPDVVRMAGLEYAEAGERVVRRVVRCNAALTYDQNRLARIGARVPGVVAEVLADLGESVTTGDTLAVIDSIDLGAAKAEHLQAIALRALWARNHEREKSLLEKGISTERDALEAETRLEEARIAEEKVIQRLRNLGLGDEEIERGVAAGDTTSRLPIRPARDGVVVERNGVAGQVVRPTDVLFVVADPSRMWATLDVYEDEIAGVRPGQEIVLRPDGLAGESVAGRITWVGTAVDPRTRTIPVRAEVESPAGLLRDGTFGRAEIHAGGSGPVVVVPREAVQWEGCCNIVFIRRSETIFEPRKVRLGHDTGRFYEVIDGLSAGDVVVTQGSFLLKTEILRESIGAGCCEPEPPSR